MSAPLTSRGVLVGGVTFALAAAGARLVGAAAKPAIVVHKSPTCGCCAAWVEHLRASGYPATGMEAPGQPAGRYQVLAFDEKGRATVFDSR